MFILHPDGSPRAINIAQAHALMVMPQGTSGDARPSIAAAFFDPSDQEGFKEDIAYFDTEATAHAGLAMFVSKMHSGNNIQALMDSVQDELRRRHDLINHLPENQI